MNAHGGGTLVDLWKSSPKSKWWPTGLASSLVTTSLLLFQPSLLRALVESVSNEGDILPASIPFVIVAVGSMVTGSLATLGQKKYLANVERHFRETVVAVMSRVDLDDPLKRMSATQVLSNDVSVVARALAELSIRAAPKVLLALGAIVMMVLIDHVMVLVIFGVIALLILSAVPTLKLMGREERTLSQHKDELSARAEEMCTLRETARGNLTLDVLADRILDVNSDIFDRQVRLAHLSFRVDPVNSAMMNVTALVVLGIGAARVAAGALGVAELLSFLMYLFMLAGPLMTLAASLQQLQAQRAAAGRLGTVIGQTTRVRARVSERRPSSSGRPRLELTDVSFTARERLILPPMTETLEAGGLTGLRGESGSGKTTLLRLLCGVLDPSTGVVAGVSDQDERHSVTYVAQRPAIIPQSLEATLALYGALQVPDRRLADVLVRFGLIRSQEDLPRFRTTCAAGRLSGGEVQRLAIASAILSARPVLLLDEPTSALDGRNARLIVGILREHAASRVVVVATHDPTVLDLVDRELALKEHAQAAA